jgi:hypothetical protein
MKHLIRPLRARTRARHLLAVLAATGLLVAGTALATSAAVITTPEAINLADAMASPSIPVTGADFVTRPPFGTPTAIADSPLAGFPTNGPTYAVLSSGDAGNAGIPGGFVSVDNGGGNAGHGNSDFDVTILRVGIDVPAPLNCLHFDFKFLSVEWPIYVGTSFNDAFIAEVDQNNWTATGSTISAPGNFAFDQEGRPVTINTSGVAAMKPEFAAGTAYNAATPTLVAGTLISPGPHSVYFSIFDQGDHILDSAAFLDNLALSFAPTPADCPSGSVVKGFDLGLTPQHAVNKTGATHTVTADLTDAETHDPISGGRILFTVTGANPQTGAGTTAADGRTSFSYVGTHAGEDVISACYVPTGDVCTPDDARHIVSVVKTWEAAPPNLALTPAAATNDVGVTHTVTADLTAADGAPISGGHLLFTVTGANEETGSATTSAAGVATFSYVGRSEGQDEITACYDANDNGVCDIDEVTGTVTKTWDVPAPALTLTPPEATEPVGELHTVTATLTSHGVLVENGKVLFRVTGANHATGEALTDAAGVADFTWVGQHAGLDTITACFDANTSDTCDFSEVSLTATAKTEWVPVAVRLSPATATDTVGGDHTVTARLTRSSGAPMVNALVIFTVTGANQASGEESTGPDGTASFTYRGRVAGTDTITACYDVDADRKCEPPDPAATATKTWLPRVPVTG